MAQNRRAQAALEQGAASSGGPLRALVARLERLREEERTRIAREVHDALGQLATGLKIDLAWCRDRAARVGDPALRQGLQERLASATGLADALLAEVQTISRDLRPGALDHLGVAAALQTEASRFQERTGIACEVSVPRSLAVGDREAVALFRTAQEALTNVARHAQADRVRLRLARRARWVVLEVADNGRGIRAGEMRGPASLGLLGMQERAAALGGHLRVRGAPGRGTTVTLALPGRQPRPRPVSPPALPGNTAGRTRGRARG
jgi:signal transduction histidine kinase